MQDPAKSYCFVEPIQIFEVDILVDGLSSRDYLWSVCNEMKRTRLSIFIQNQKEWYLAYNNTQDRT